jgi:hypothetical protein
MVRPVLEATTMTMRESGNPPIEDRPQQRCCSAEAAVVRWALTHMASFRLDTDIQATSDTPDSKAAQGPEPR